jgi:hypothetical protein
MQYSILYTYFIHTLHIPYSHYLPLPYIALVSPHKRHYSTMSYLYRKLRKLLARDYHFKLCFGVRDAPR